MMRTRRLLTWILILELVVTGGLVIRRTSRPDMGFAMTPTIPTLALLR